MYDNVRRRDDYRCQVWGCGKTDIHVHHIIFRSQGGTTEEWNLICLCHKHHHQVHDRQLNILDILLKIKYRHDFVWHKALTILLGEKDAKTNTGT